MDPLPLRPLIPVVFRTGPGGGPPARMGLDDARAPARGNGVVGSTVAASVVDVGGGDEDEGGGMVDEDGGPVIFGMASPLRVGPRRC